MDGQPQSALGHLLDGVGCAGGQEQVVAGFEFDTLACHVEQGFALQQDHPFVLGLHVLAGRDFGRAVDALDDQVFVGQERVEALPHGGRGGGVVKEILDALVLPEDWWFVFRQINCLCD
jgi:hypothetical protein